MTKRRDAKEYAIRARGKISKEFQQLPIFNRPRSVALYNYVAASEADTLTGLLKGGQPSLLRSHRRLVESSLWAIPRIFEVCPNSDETVQIVQTIFEEAAELLDFAWKYENVQYSFELADRGQFQFFVAARDPRISFDYAAKDADRADTMIRARELKNMSTNFGDADPSQSVSKIAEELKIAIKSEPGKICEYEFTNRLCELAQEYGNATLMKLNPLEIPSGEEFSSLRFRDLQAFWSALTGIVEMHWAAHQIAHQGELVDEWIETIVLNQPRKDFAELISRCSGLQKEIAEELIAWHTYDRSIAGDTPILQPFIPLGGNRLCLPSQFIRGNSFERNFRKLANRHPQLRIFGRKLEGRLESIALDQIEKLFPEPKYRVRKQIEIPGVTDADLVIFDFSCDWVLIMQHKWLIAPDKLLESSANDEKLAAGVRQAVRAKESFEKEPSFLKAKMDLDPQQELKRITAITVCRGLAHTGFLFGTQVPVIGEVDLRCLLECCDSLEELYEAALSRPDQQEAATDAVEIKTRFELCGYEFVFPGFGVFD
ncbi:hypothetical protein MYX84_11485 [Acidobacteria bacterium AH-259-O06]|nr:hypothetical protein [Acidobacteria bacterium AH-259-O06]